MPILHSLKENKLEYEDENEVEIKMMGTEMYKESLEHNLHKNDITPIIASCTRKSLEKHQKLDLFKVLGDTADFWDKQLNWKLISWKLHSSSGVEEFKDSDDDDLAKSDHEAAEKSKRLAGKELSNPFIADDLLKIIWLSMYHGLTNLNIGYQDWSAMKTRIAPVAIIDCQLPFEYTIASRSTDVMVPIPPALAADSAGNMLAEWNAVYDAYNEVACLMFESITLELHRQFENYPPYEMLQELKSMFEK
ncbi:hypothetical protein Tco_1054245 [Tanacetum coccineum]|uniref:Uncharacterized protein n=1 Tax=Tanacetum coccineum TaxID=301880 RepID=A0ABQ5GW75_9ASTR